MVVITHAQCVVTDTHRARQTDKLTDRNEKLIAK